MTDPVSESKLERASEGVQGVKVLAGEPEDNLSIPGEPGKGGRTELTPPRGCPLTSTHAHDTGA